MRLFLALIASILVVACVGGPCLAQDQTSPFLMRLERQTRDENVCMLLQQDGHYHLERIITGRPRVFEGTLPESSVSEIQPLLNSSTLANLQQSQIESSLVSEDMDQVLLAVSRPTGWQSLNFPSGKSRKPFKGEMDPILKWLDRNKQQQNPIVGASPSRCMPPQNAQAETTTAAKPNSANPYMMRIVVDHYESSRLSGGAADTKTKVQSTNSAPTMNSMADMKVTRLCAIVYDSGRYRLEKSIQEFGSQMRSEIYRDTLDKAQLADLRQVLDNPKLVALPNSTAPAVFGREGDLISLAVPREKGVQALAFTSFFGARTQEAGMRDNMSTAVSTNVELTHPIRKWIKQNLEERKTAKATDVSATACVPSTQPE